MNIFLNKIFSENKFLKLSSLLFLFLPFAIISGNFLTNFFDNLFNFIYDYSAHTCKEY